MLKVQKRNLSETTAVSEPTLDEELKTFKAIVRHITKYEIEPKAAMRFTADNRPRLRRLGNLGINGHQPAIAAYCKMTRDEKGKVIDAIIKQVATIESSCWKLYGLTSKKKGKLKPKRGKVLNP